MEFIRDELLTTEKASLNMLRNSSMVADGVKAGIRFERPEGYVDALRAGDLSQVPDFGKRLGYAERFGAVSSGVPSVPGLEGATLSDSTISKLNSQFDDISSGASQVNTSFSRMGNALDQSNLSIVSSANGVSTTLSNGGAQVGNALTQVSTDITKSGNDLFNALQEMASKAGGSVTKGLGGLIDIGKGWSGDGFDLSAGKLSDWMHTGGIIGRGAGVSWQADTSLWDNARKFHTGGIVGGLKSRERPTIAKDEEAIFPTVRMSDGNFGICATGFNGGGGGGGGNTISIGDINITTQGSSGNAQQDAEHAKMMAREMRAQVEDLVNAALIKQSRSGGMLRRGM
ncbi:hypothetical protein ASF59_00020 [Methylobacterium sp. Leaf121]|nr:hypothetical protein ASF59_00020 [Methylobacterium sp. Leaf121]